MRFIGFYFLIVLFTKLLASDLVSLGYGIGVWKSSTDEDNIAKIYMYGFAFTKNTETYILNAGIAKGKTEIENVAIESDYYLVESDFTAYGADFAYKVINKNHFIVAPSLSFSMYQDGDSITYTNNRTGIQNKIVQSQKNDDTGISLSLNVMYQLDEDIDNYIYITYDIDDDLRESEDFDYHSVRVGFSYKIYQKLYTTIRFSKALDVEEDTKELSSLSFKLTYKI